MTSTRPIFATVRALLMSTVFITVTACVPPTYPTAASPNARAPAGDLNALTQLTTVKEELKKLRNAVEELQFNAETAKRRQQNLFQDLDRRLLSLERAQRLSASDGFSNGLPQGIGGVGGGLPINDPALAVEAAIGAGTTTTPTATTPAATNGDGAQDNAVTLPEQQAYEKAFNFLKQSRYEDAVVGFQRLVSTWPQSQLADDAYYWMSEARYVNREFEAALVGFRTVATRYPDSVRVPEALLKIGYIRYDIGAYEQAAEIFRDILKRFPGHQVAVSAETRLRRIEQTIQQ